MVSSKYEQSPASPRLGKCKRCRRETEYVREEDAGRVDAGVETVNALGALQVQ
jgi:hypothetical protein